MPSETTLMAVKLTSGHTALVNLGLVGAFIRTPAHTIFDLGGSQLQVEDPPWPEILKEIARGAGRRD